MLTLQSRNCKEIYSDFNVDGLVNIVRFNVRHFLAKMDNPVKEIFMPDDVSGIVKVQAKLNFSVWQGVCSVVISDFFSGGTSRG